MNSTNPNNLSPIISFKDLAIGYDGQTILSDLHGAIYPGELVIVTGPNGSGKTTLLKTLAGIIPPISGTLLITLTRDRSAISYMPQTYDAEPTIPITTAEMVALGIVGRKSFPGLIPRKAIHRIQTVLKKLHIEDLINKQFRVLSGGQKRRVLLARALVIAPEVLICDELTTGLDSEAAAQVVTTLNELRKHEKLTIICSTHSPELFRGIATKIWNLSEHRPMPS